METEKEKNSGKENEVEVRRNIREKTLILLSKSAIEKTIKSGKINIQPPHEIVEKVIKEYLELEGIALNKEKEEELKEEIIKELSQKKGVFVTLRLNGEVRGCIGTFQEDEIWIQVQKYAVFSAFNDPRFPPLQEEEFKNIKVEISLIENVVDVKDVNEIELGKDGVIIEVKGKGGVLLPEVAIEFGVKTPEEFLSMVCKKINLPPECWKIGKIKKFRTDKIKEK